jgi:predicted RNase H-like nuclease (RuvC/YqgF family)
MNTELISLILNIVFGGGFLLTAVTLRAQKKKADAEAKNSELDNVQEAIKIWREMAESLKAERDEYKQSYTEVLRHNSEMEEQVEAIRKELTRLTNINSKMVKLLDKITAENLSEMIETIKKLHNEN